MIFYDHSYSFFQPEYTLTLPSNGVGGTPCPGVGSTPGPCNPSEEDPPPPSYSEVVANKDFYKGTDAEPEVNDNDEFFWFSVLQFLLPFV